MSPGGLEGPSKVHPGEPGFVLKPAPYYTESATDNHTDWVAGASLTRQRPTGPGRVRFATTSLRVCDARRATEGVPVMKKILLLLATAAGVLAIQKKFRDQQAEQDLWAEATDKV